MGLRTRTFMIVALTLGMMFAALFFVVRQPLEATFDDLERERATADGNRLASAASAQLGQLAEQAASWAPRNQTYAYMRGEPSSLEEELPPSVVSQLGANVVLFVDEDGAVVYSESVDLGLGTATARDDSAIQAILDSPGLMSPGDPRAHASGFIAAPKGVMLVASQSITTADLYAPPEGTLILGRYVDEALVDSLAEATGLPVTAFPVEAGLPEDVADAVSLARGAKGVVARPLDEERMGIFVTVRDLDDEPAVVLYATTPRGVSAAGRRAVSYFGAAMLLFGAVATIVVALVVDRSVLTRIGRLSSEMAKIAVTDDRASRVTTAGNDEISSLSSDINDALAAFERSQKELVQAHDLLEARVAERTEDLRASERQYRSLVERLADAVFVVDMKGTITYGNGRTMDLLDQPLDRIVGTPFASHLSPASAEELARLAARGRLPDNPVTFEGRIGDGVSGPRTVELRSVPLRDESGAVAGTQWIVRDVAERKRFEEQLVHMASHDYLTGLFNRQFFESALELELAETRRTNKGGAILWLDVDDFKEVNDSLGHRAGDEVLGELATALHQEVRESTILSRLGGDEFALLMPGVSVEEAEAVASRLLARINSQTYTAAHHTVRLSVSIGVVLYPLHGSTAQELLANADVAMYLAKASGRSCVHMHRVDENWKSELKSRVTWNERLAAALQEDRFRVYAQPVLDLRTGGIPRYELLIRMLLDGEIVAPAEFLPAAERLGVIREIDRFMVMQAITLLEQDALAGASLDVNLSGRAFTDPDLLATMEREIRRAGISPQRLGLEITETAAIADMAKAQQFICTLKDLGCRFSLDDFGSGFSSFYYLKHLPIDCLKVDGSFVRGLAGSRQDQHLVGGIVELCRGLGVEIAVEFVEDAETLEIVRQLGVDYVQGFHVGRPVPVEEAVASRVGSDE